MSYPSEPSSSHQPMTPPDLAPSLCPIVNKPVAPASATSAGKTSAKVAGVAASETTPLPLRRPQRAKLSRRDLANLTSQMAIMLQSGVDVASTLQSMARQSKKVEQARVLNAVHQDVLAGKSFSVALQPYQHVFGASYVATVAAGEASGKMADILAQLSSLLRSELRLRNSIRMLLAYPLVLMAVSSVVTLALVLFVLPRFAEIFAQFDTPLPALTQVLLSGSTELRERYWLWGPLGLLIIGGSVLFRLSATGQRLWDTFLLKAYLIRDVSQMLLMGRVCRLLGMMVESGVPLLDSLRIVQSSVRNSLYRKVLADLEHDVLNGRGLGDALLKSDVIPASASEMLVTAEQTGNLGSVTHLIGEHFEEEGETRLRDIVTLIEPLITIGMGLIVAVVVAAVMLPMFDMATFAEG